jgi:hypothetical protein
LAAHRVRQFGADLDGAVRWANHVCCRSLYQTTHHPLSCNGFDRDFIRMPTPNIDVDNSGSSATESKCTDAFADHKTVPLDLIERDGVWMFDLPCDTPTISADVVKQLLNN